MKRARGVNFFDLIPKPNITNGYITLSPKFDLFVGYIKNVLLDDEYNTYLKKSFDDVKLEINNDDRDIFFYHFENVSWGVSDDYFSSHFEDVLKAFSMWSYKYKERIPTLIPLRLIKNYVEWNPYRCNCKDLHFICKKSIIYFSWIIKHFPKDIRFLIIKMIVNNWIDLEKILKV